MNVLICGWNEYKIDSQYVSKYNSYNRFDTLIQDGVVIAIILPLDIFFMYQ